MLIGAFFADAAPKDALDDIDFFQFPIIDPRCRVAEEAPTDGYFASAKTQERPTAPRSCCATWPPPRQQKLYIKNSSGTALPTHPDVEDAESPRW